MKLLTLWLQAFGPFTDTVLDFDRAPNLHMIFGPNEAGKSSALRAMTDLRFGIPNRTQDDFIHPFNQMRIGGVFLGGKDERIGLIRRKGRSATLTRFDFATGQPDLGLSVTPELELALTGGLERGESEAMFGLNHLRLREGGDLLLKGEGELGSALFEASAGTLGIASILDGLDADAKRIYNPHGAVKSAIINQARRQFEEQRQLLRQAQTKPNDWQTLHRAHETAAIALLELDQQLEAQHRHENELTELRTIKPLLQDQDRMQTEVDSYANIPDLPENAREQRLAAEQAVQRIQLDIQDAHREMAQCTEHLTALAIEPALLNSSDAIERLSSCQASATRSRLEIRQQQAVIENMQAAIATATARIGLDSEKLMHSMPSAGERSCLDHHLMEVARLGERLDHDRHNAEKLGQVLKLHSHNAPLMPEHSRCLALSIALRQAQGLGDTDRQQADLNRQLRSLNSQLAQHLSDLKIPSVESLRRINPVLESEIVGTMQTLAAIDKEIHTTQDEESRMGRDLEQQRLRRRQFQAEGEIVTAETLRQARNLRDLRWQKIRHAYVESQEPVTEPEASVADVFEASLTEADRQADILRSDAKRAAGFEECSSRIEQMEKRGPEIANKLRSLDAQAQAIHSGWSQRLAQAGLPDLPTDSLREWQIQRMQSITLHDRLAELQAELDLVEAKSQSAASTLSKALQSVGCQTMGSGQAANLPALIEQAVLWEKTATETQAKFEERMKSLHIQQLEQEQILQRIAETEATFRCHQDGLLEWHSRLLLKPDAPIQAIKARLEELDALERQYTLLNDVLLRKAQQQAVIDDYETQARQLAALLGEPAPEHIENFIDKLQKRLNFSKEQEHLRTGLMRDQARAAEKLKLAQAGLETQTELLEQLCQAANVQSTEQLPERERLASNKRMAKDSLLQLRNQLAQASTKNEASLRQSLAGLDIVAIESERERCKTEIARLEHERASARQKEEHTRRALEAIDASDNAAKAKEAMESAAARWRSALRPWARLRLAHALLAESLNRFRERAQAPMIAHASAYFMLMTGGRYPKLVAEDQDGKPVLRASRTDGLRIGVEAMSEGTADQLYLALRMAALELRRASHPQMPLVLDDVLVTSDDQRAVNILRALAQFAKGGQVMLFTHHQHLIELAKSNLNAEEIAFHSL